MRRSGSKRAARLGDQIMREVAEILAAEVADPRLELVTISGVRMNPDLRVAEVLYTVGGDEQRRAQAAEGLEHARGYVRKQLGRRLETRRLPELRFRPDDFLEDMVYGGRQGADSPDS